MSDLDPQQRIALIKENLSEVLRLDIIENVIVNENRPLSIYWGQACPKALVWLT
jgi:tyrosyl-tRNA synthetase